MKTNLLTLPSVGPLFSGSVVSVFLAVIPSLTLAQAVIPNAGSILQQLQPSAPPAPAPGGPALITEKPSTAKTSSGAPFLVTSIVITGNKKISTETLHALVADGEGKSLTLEQLEKLSDRITAYYQSHGYPLARAIIPAQTITNGIVNITIMVARYGKISLNNTSRLDGYLLESTLASLAPGSDIEQQELDKALLLVSDIPGVVINAQLKPGEAVGTSDLEVTTTSSGSRVSGNAGLDNNGNTYTGRARVSATVNVIDPLDLIFSNVLSLSALSSGKNLNYGRMAYDVIVNGQGTHVGTSLSALRYRLGKNLSALDASGTAQVASLYAKHPFIRSRDVNLYGQVQYDRLQLKDHVGVSDIATDRHLDDWTLSLIWDARDSVFSGGVNSWSAGWTNGRVNYSNAYAQSIDAATAASQGDFSKLTINLSRLQRLSESDSLYVSFASQWTNNNLDASQKITVGGPYSVRAYDTGAVSGDTGYQTSIELRHDLGVTSFGQWQAVAFVDNANVTVNKNPWVAGTNTATLSGVGLGINWMGPQQWNAKAYFAKPVGSAPELLGSTNSARTWVEVNKGF